MIDQDFVLFRISNPKQTNLFIPLIRVCTVGESGVLGRKGWTWGGAEPAQLVKREKERTEQKRREGRKIPVCIGVFCWSKIEKKKNSKKKKTELEDWKMKVRSERGRTKVVIRHLPPSLTQSDLLQQIHHHFPPSRYNWFSFRPGNTT